MLPPAALFISPTALNFGAIGSTRQVTTQYKDANGAVVNYPSSFTTGGANLQSSGVSYSIPSGSQFPVGETRFATYRNPVVTPWDGETATIGCWVRHVSGDTFQVFAVNCAHLGCPVRWFAQSGLFMCPCHGGAYYADGARASGPPERGLFEYRYAIDSGHLMIEAGEMPTPGSLATAGGKRPWSV